jgi:hypothetical protein
MKSWENGTRWSPEIVASKKVVACEVKYISKNLFFCLNKGERRLLLYVKYISKKNQKWRITRKKKRIKNKNEKQKKDTRCSPEIVASVTRAKKRVQKVKKWGASGDSK